MPILDDIKAYLECEQPSVLPKSPRGVATGGDNRPFFGCAAGGTTAVILTSFVTICKRLQIELFAYLRDIFQQIGARPAKGVANLLRDNWKAAQSPTQNTVV